MPGVGIGWIEPGAQPPLLDVRGQLGAAKWQQRSHEGTTDWSHAGKPRWAGAGQDPHEHGLDLVVGLVARQNGCRASPCTSFFQPGVAPSPCQGLTSRRAKFQLSHLHRQIVRTGQTADPCGNPSTLRMDSVIGMGYDEIEPVHISRPGQKIQQGYGVRATGDRYQ
jgi:hypothetical protein